MTGWLLDTNVLSELRRPRPEPKVLAFAAARRLADLHAETSTSLEGLGAVAEGAPGVPGEGEPPDGPSSDQGSDRDEEAGQLNDTTSSSGEE